jgi:hypothetical protein
MAFKMKGFSAFTKTDPPVKDKVNKIKREKVAQTTTTADDKDQFQKIEKAGGQAQTPPKGKESGIVEKGVDRVHDEVAQKQTTKGDEYVPQSRRDGDGDNPQTNQPIDKVNHYTPQSKSNKKTEK